VRQRIYERQLNLITVSGLDEKSQERLQDNCTSAAEGIAWELVSMRQSTTEVLPLSLATPCQAGLIGQWVRRTLTNFQAQRGAARRREDHLGEQFITTHVQSLTLYPDQFGMLQQADVIDPEVCYQRVGGGGKAHDAVRYVGINESVSSTLRSPQGWQRRGLTYARPPSMSRWEFTTLRAVRTACSA
jgi:hypothetical protein